MLAVAISPRGLITVPKDEAVLSPELHTAGLLQPHVWVGYWWQNTRLCTPFCVITAVHATSCRTTPNRLYAQPRLIYQPELLTCPHCNDRLALCNYLAWDKIVQTLRGVLSIASRPSHCRHATCEGAQLRLLSAEAQGIALAGSTYGYDVIVRIGWWRQHYHATYREIHIGSFEEIEVEVLEQLILVGDQGQGDLDSLLHGRFLQAFDHPFSVGLVGHFLTDVG